MLTMNIMYIYHYYSKDKLKLKENYSYYFTYLHIKYLKIYFHYFLLLYEANIIVRQHFVQFIRFVVLFQILDLKIVVD